MNIHQIIARYLVATGLIFLGGALIYFSYAIIYTVNQVPEIIEAIDKTSVRVDRVLDEITIISEQIPPVVEQADLLQQNIPLILAEVKSSRILIPDVLNEVELTRQQIPLILAEVKAVQEALPKVMNELEAYRKLMPDILAEMAAVREIIPPTLDRAESLAKEVSKAGQKASEGVVMGFFSGIIKLPFKMFDGVKDKFTSADLSNSDVHEIRGAVIVALQSEIGSRHNWKNPDSKHTGVIEVISENTIEGKYCRKLSITVSKHNKQIESRNTEVCQQDDGEWELNF